LFLPLVALLNSDYRDPPPGWPSKVLRKVASASPASRFSRS